MGKKKRPGNNDTKYFTTAQMCERHHCHRSTLQRWVEQGLIPPPIATHPGRENRYVQAQVKARERKIEPKVDSADDEEMSSLSIEQVIERKRMENYLEEQQHLDEERQAQAAIRAAAKEKERKTRERMQELLPQEPTILATKLIATRRKK